MAKYDPKIVMEFYANAWPTKEGTFSLPCSNLEQLSSPKLMLQTFTIDLLNLSSKINHNRTIMTSPATDTTLDGGITLISDASIQSLTNQMGQLATQLNQQQSQNSDKLPSQSVQNPKNVSAISLRSGKQCQGPQPIAPSSSVNEPAKLHSTPEKGDDKNLPNNFLKRFYQVKVKGLDTTSIKELGQLMEPLQMQAFRKTYGKILELTIAEVSIEAIASLTQYYDQPLRCFTFGDFQLVPTIEEFEEILGCPLGGRKPYLFSGCLPSLSRIATVVKDSARGLDRVKQTRNGIAGLPRKKDQELRGIRNGIIGGYHEWLKVHIRGLDWLAKLKVVSEESFEAPEEDEERLCETETNMLAIIAKYQEELGLATTHEHRIADEYAQVYAEKEARGRVIDSLHQEATMWMDRFALTLNGSQELPRLLAKAKAMADTYSAPEEIHGLLDYCYMSSSFADLVFAGERIEVGLKRGKFDYVSSMSANAKRIGTTGAKRKEGDAHAVSSTPAWYAQYHPSFSAHTGNASGSAPVHPKAPTQREAPQVPTPNTTRPAGNPNATRNFPPRPFQEFTSLPMTYEDLLPSLIANHLAVVTPGKVLQPPFPKWYDPNATCKYHGGVPGHSIEKCLALKYKVQHLIDAGWLTFQEDRPNVRTNPLANHGGGAVNAVESDRPRRSKPLKDVATPRRFIFEALQKGGVIPHSGRKEDSCLLHFGELHDMETCLGVEELLQRMIDQGRLEVASEGREEQHICMQSTDGSSVVKPKPLVIYFTNGTASQKPGHPLVAKPVPFPYQNSHAVPWRYTPPREKEEEATDVSSLSAKVTNITGLSGVTRSGRVFAPPNLPVQPANVKGKGKVVEEQDGEAPHALNKDILAKGLLEKKDGKKEVSLEEASEFLRIIQQSEFKVIEQLNKTPARVSLLELLMSSEPHRALLIKVLNEAHSFEVVSISSVDSFSGQACLSDAAVMMARVMLGNGYEPGMGLGKDNGGITSLINAKGNRGKYGLGYKPTQVDVKRSIAGRKGGGQSSRLRQESEGSPPCHISRSFISAGLGDEGQVVAIYEDDVPSTLDLVRPCPPDFQLGNWRKMAPRKLASKRSRKDKAAEGTSSAPEYDSHRFRSAVHQQRFEAIKGWSFLRERRVQLRDDEYTDFQEEIGRRRWASLVTPMAKFDPEVVLEFYSNAWPIEEGVRDMRSWVRGQWIPFDAYAIGQLLGYPLRQAQGDAPQAAGAPPPPHQAGPAGSFDMEQYLRHLVRQQAANHRAHVQTHDCLYQMSLSMQSQGFASFSCPTPDQFRAKVAWPGD
ncbi:hypothetical protein GmHk_10G028631 [Glycine max]|nr:hypothetical protein GmHk_10G028631 [Glycine max]